MVGLADARVYLDWNASAPLRPEARAAMLAAMDVVGNPSSVHAEGRAAKAIVEKARGQVAALVGCEPGEVVFTSGATEGAASAFPSRYAGRAIAAPIEHDCVWAYRSEDMQLACDGNGLVDLSNAAISRSREVGIAHGRLAIQSANPETGVEQPIEQLAQRIVDHVSTSKALKKAFGGSKFFSDIVQSVGKRRLSIGKSLVRSAIISAHKIGGPKGIGALYDFLQVLEEDALILGGGQEQGRRAGTENVMGIAGFGAAAEAAQRDLEAGVWDRVAKIRDDLEDRLAAAAPDLQIFGREVARLPNTSCFAVPGWKGETQVMQMDLAGFAISAGSACSSGKVNKASRVLLAMGFDEVTASSAIRVSMGPTTTEAEVMAFADAWIGQYRRRRERAA